MLMSGARGRGGADRGRRGGSRYPVRYNRPAGLRPKAAHRGRAVVAQRHVLTRRRRLLVLLQRRRRLVDLVRRKGGRRESSGVGGKGLLRRLLLMLPPRGRPRLWFVRMLAVLTTFALPTLLQLLRLLLQR